VAPKDLFDVDQNNITGEGLDNISIDADYQGFPGFIRVIDDENQDPGSARMIYTDMAQQVDA
jgi:hypothetical protein